MGEDKGCFRYGKMAENASFATPSLLNFWMANFRNEIKDFRVVAQPGSVLAWGASGRWFESSPPDFVREPFGFLYIFFGM